MGKRSFNRSLFKKEHLAVWCAVICVCAAGPKKHERRFFAFDTIVEITLYSNAQGAELDLDSVQRMMLALDTQLSISQSTSDVYRINHRKDSVVTVSGPVKSMLTLCREEFNRSKGLFDVTVEPLKYLYGLESHQTAHHVPSKAQLDSVLAVIGFGRIVFVNDSTLIMPRGARIDLGGIAKGYILKTSRRFLAGRGYASFLINAGGDLVVNGTKPRGEPWRIGIQDPRNDTALFARLSVIGAAVFTSGDYERYFMEGNRRYHHLFDPKTGLPGRHSMSATVSGDDPMVIDAAVKTAFLMPVGEALTYLKTQGLGGLIIDSAGGAWATASLKAVLIPQDPSRTIRFR